MECSILTQSFIENNDFFTVGYSSGYLHKNHEGNWYPVCTPNNDWATESCHAETGASRKETPKITTVPVVKDLDKGPYLSMSSSGLIKLVANCSDEAIYVDCPPIPCGTRVLSRHDAFRPYGVFEDFLVAAPNPQTTKNIKNSDRNDDESTENDVRLQSLLELEDEMSENFKIVGGRASQPKAWPSIVAIYRDGLFNCGGVIINPSWVLTAAHCLNRFV